MFTGLVEALGTVAVVRRGPEGLHLVVKTPLATELQEGDSIAVNGICLTATELDEDSFSAEAMNETVTRTSLDDLRVGSRVNLELPVRASERLGGHIVQGHVDGVGTVSAAQQDGFSRKLVVEPPAELLRYVVEKGSVAVDGVSLTVAALDGRSFTVSLIPETLERTALDKVRPGDRVNVEVDVLAKYVEKLVMR